MHCEWTEAPVNEPINAPRHGCRTHERGQMFLCIPNCFRIAPCSDYHGEGNSLIEPLRINPEDDWHPARDTACDVPVVASWQNQTASYHGHDVLILEIDLGLCVNKTWVGYGLLRNKEHLHTDAGNEGPCLSFAEMISTLDRRRKKKYANF